MHTPYTGSYVAQHRLGIQLTSVLVGELHLCRKLHFPVFVLKDGFFNAVLPAGSSPDREQINQLIKSAQREVFVHQRDRDEIKMNLQSAMIKVTRSLSVGDPVENGSKGLKLISLNLQNLYQNPHDDELLTRQFQGTQNLSKFFIDQKKHLPFFYQQQNKDSCHFTISQPMLSSILMTAYLQSIHLFHEREIENLFLTSYFKDFGLSIIPAESYDVKILGTKDENLFSKHSEYSHSLLEGRVPLARNYLNIIKHHHFLNHKLKQIIQEGIKSEVNPEMVMGLESTLVAVFDILVAMINERPYRRSLSLYQSLEVIKKIMADDYPQEFKALVIFLKQFFKN
jgi:response regulator RpfG family c-di-GMP phosphodiesterase